MATITGPNEGIKHNWDLGTFYKTDMDDTLRLIDEVLHLGVIDKDLAAQPGSPTLGDRYILPSAGLSGADWPGNENSIAIYTELDAGNDWEFRAPKLGWVAMVQDENMLYYWNGTSWTLLVAPPTTSEPITDLATTGPTPMDLNLGRNFRTPGATGNVTLSFSNVPGGVRTQVAYTWRQDGVGGRTLSFPAGTIWAGGVAPTPSSGANEEDDYLFDIDDAGVIKGNVVGQAYA